MKLPHGRALSLLLAALCVAFALPAGARAGVGERLDEAKQTDFFKFFGLEEEGARTRAAGGGEVAAFRPRGGQFRRLVKVTFTLDGAGVIRSAELALERSFVDDPAAGVFARDIAKSFLRFAVPRGDEAGVGDLANEIEFPKELKGYNIVRAAPEPRLPAQPTRGYLVYLGKLPLYQQALAQSTLRLENVRTPEGGALHITVRGGKLRRTLG